MSPSRFVKFQTRLIVLALGGAAMFSAACSSGGTGSNPGPGGSGPGGGTGGASGTTCTAGEKQVCFKDGKAEGAMTGYGWVALGMLDTLTDPTCDTDRHAIDSAHACTTMTNWSTSGSLCISGTIPALPAAPVQSDYDNNWGIQIGVNTSEPPGITLGKPYTSMAITVAGSPLTGLRAIVHVKGEPAGQAYCAELMSGQAIPMTKFNLECWNGDAAAPSKALTADNVPNIDKIGIQVSSTSTEIKVDKLCLQSVAFQ
jgi:hypothetical protein